MGTSYRDRALARLDMLAFLAKQGVEIGKPVGPNEVRFRCPFHDDKNPSANANTETKLWSCHTCDKGGSAIDFLMEGGAEYRAALAAVGEFAGLEPLGHHSRSNGAGGAPSPAPIQKTKGKLTEANVKAWFEAGQRNPELVRWFHEHRGYTDETVALYQLGWDGQRVTIPVRDEDGDLVNVRRYLRDAGGEQGKMIPLMGGSGPDVTTRLFPGEKLPEEAILVEGEWDAIIGRQYGLDTVTVTAGAGIWNPSLTPLFKDRKVILLYDNDEAGQKGALKVARVLSSAGVEVRIARIPNLPPKGDLTDFFVEQGRSPDELGTILDEAAPFIVAPDAHDEPEATRVPLHLASDAKYRGTRQELPVLLSGKAMTPYTIPNRFRVKCDVSNKRLCGICPLLEHNGDREVTLDAGDPAALSLVGVSTREQHQALKVLAKAIRECNRPQIEILDSINVEELRLIPEIDTRSDEGGDTEYVGRTGYFLGHGLLPNRSYLMRGYVHPHPKTQATVHLLSEAEPAQDNISAFHMTPDLRKQLAVFQGDPATAFHAVYDDFADNVHRIRDRFDMQVAYDLAWHSVVAFYFNGAFTRRGWVEALVMGDSGQGKSEMATNLLRHYGLGARVAGEQASGAGLLGGLEKMGDSWILSWGRVPLNDKRLLIIDEAQGIHASQVEGMSDVRASGVAEITKIRTERTNARCRLIWLANPVTGLTLSQHNQGVIAIKQLFKKPEDIRRLDVAITVASGDVDYARSINVRHGEAEDPKYPGDLCRSLVLWAWSRRPDQIVFEPDATDAILAAATKMGRRYHASIPLVEPSDQRLKLARLATAAAARTFSTDDGERIVVTKAHVDFVVDFLERVYNARSMSYGEYSDAAAKTESLSDEEEEQIRADIESWENRNQALDFFRQAEVFKKSELIDVVGWEKALVEVYLRRMASFRLVRPTREGFRKTPAFIALLRTITGLDVTDAAVDEEGEPF